MTSEGLFPTSDRTETLACMTNLAWTMHVYSGIRWRGTILRCLMAAINSVCTCMMSHETAAKPRSHRLYSTINKQVTLNTCITASKSSGRRQSGAGWRSSSSNRRVFSIRLKASSDRSCRVHGWWQTVPYCRRDCRQGLILRWPKSANLRRKILATCSAPLIHSTEWIWRLIKFYYLLTYLPSTSHRHHNHATLLVKVKVRSQVVWCGVPGLRTKVGTCGPP